MHDMQRTLYGYRLSGFGPFVRSETHFTILISFSKKSILIESIKKPRSEPKTSAARL
ncbi:MAG: hypothetical protein EPGJADBJ_01137 [Saprospiraceae bacterium]|nr:hypothetical protein [Saprospiraceae bacterium]